MIKLLLHVGVIVGPGDSCWQDYEIGRRSSLSYILFYTDSNSAKQSRRVNTRSQAALLRPG